MEYAIPNSHHQLIAAYGYATALTTLTEFSKKLHGTMDLHGLYI